MRLSVYSLSDFPISVTGPILFLWHKTFLAFLIRPVALTRNGKTREIMGTSSSKPDTPKNCTIVNQTSSALGVECVAGFDGGQSQIFELKVYAGSKLLDRRRSESAPSFQVSGLDPGLELKMEVNAGNSKGWSEPFNLSGFTLKAAEKQTGPPDFPMMPWLGVLCGVAAFLAVAAGVALLALKFRAGGRGPSRPARPAQLPLKDKAALPLRSDVEDLQAYSDKDERNPDLIPCNKDSDYQLGTPGQKKASPGAGPTAPLRNGDIFSKQDNRDVERERYIGRQDEEVTYAELVLAGRGIHNTTVVDANGGSTLRRAVVDREPTIYAQIDHGRKPPSLGTTSGTLGTPLSPAGSMPPLREIVTVRTPLMASQQESCV